MFKNYLKIALRNLKRHKLYSIINILGLTFGMTACLLIGVFVQNELSYDQFHKHADRIVRVTMDYSSAGTIIKTALTGTKVGPQFQRTFPQIKHYVRTMKASRSVAVANKNFDEKRVLYADAAFFSLFSFNLKAGDPTTVLDAPNKIVLSETAAKKYFGNANPLGKTLKIDGNDEAYAVTGVVADAPANSQIMYDVIVSFSSLRAAKTELWNTANYVTYLLLNDPNQIGVLAKGIEAYMQQVNREEMSFATKGDYWTYHLEPLKSVHLYSNVGEGLEPNGNITYVYVLGSIALLILLIAGVNYTNLATAQSVNRSVEIGVRKVLGAQRKQLIRQLLGESIVTTIMALILSYIAGWMLLPALNNITGKDFSVTVFFQPVVVLFIFILAAFIGLLAGAYPAFVLSSSRLTVVLKSGLSLSGSGVGLRRALIVVQFVIAIGLIAVTFIVTRQIAFIRNKNIGYERAQVLVLPIDRKTKPQYEALKAAFLLNPGVLSVTGAYETPTSIGWSDGISTVDGSGPKELSVNATPVDLDYLKTLGIQLTSGRDFNKNDFEARDAASNSLSKPSFIVNEKAVRDLGWTPAAAIGKMIAKGDTGTIIGVVRDFNFESMRRAVGPLVIFPDTGMVRQLFVKIEGQRTEQTLAALAAIWKSRVPHRSFDYYFMDDEFNDLYHTEARTARLFSLFSSMAILLACLGLFALAAFMTVQRAKEIGIRKVLGANTAMLILLVAKEFLLMVGIALVIATPLAWWAGNSWLNDFAYRIHVQASLFILTGVIALLIAFCAVFYHAYKAAASNPVKSVRTE